MSKRNRKKQISSSGGAGNSNPLNFEQELFEALGENEYKILKPTIQESQLLYQNAKYYYSVNEFVGALVSYSCASVLINSAITQLQASLDTATGENTETIQTIMDKANNILECCLESVEELQQKVSISSSSGERKNETKEKWEKRCLNIQPLVLSGKSCIFYDDVIGLHKEKAQINSAFISPLMYPNLFPKTSKGILLFGPPGTGKTLLVKAAVNELQKKGGNQVGVFYFAPSPADLKGKYVGETEKKIEEWFTCASYAACQSELSDNCKPKKFISIIFIDEMDSIAGDRSNDPTGLNSNSVNTLLQMMDGISSKENVAVIGVTNYPWTLDSAIIRRFDTQILVGLPKISEIQELLDYEMNSSLNLKKKISNFCEKTTFDKEETGDNDKKAISCGVVCTDNTPAEKLILGEFYKKFIIEYYRDNNNDPNKLSQVKGIVTRIYKDGFTNSDITRFFRTALRHTGELTVETSLFYSTGLVGDTEKPEKYMSAITQISDEKKGIELSMKILNELMPPTTQNDTQPKKEGSSIPIYHDKPPEISVIEFDNYYYYNIKCILCKDNDMLLNHRLLRGIYIRGNKKGEPFNEKSYKNAFYKTKGYAETGVSAVYSGIQLSKDSTINKVVGALGTLGVGVGVGALGAATQIAGPGSIIDYSAAAGLGIFGITFLGSKAEYIAKFLAQSVDDLVGGADKDIIIEFDVNFEKINKTSVSNLSSQTLISKSNVWCFFESFMEMYNSIYKSPKPEEVLKKYQNYEIDGEYILNDTEKNQFVTFTKSEDNNFYVTAPPINPNDNLVAKFLKEKFLANHKDFTECFENLDKGEYYGLYNYLLLLNLFDNGKITNIGKAYFNKDILRIVNEDDKANEFSEEKEYPIYGSSDTIKLKFKKRTEEEEKENKPQNIIISVEDYIKIIPYYENYNGASGVNDSQFVKSTQLLIDFSIFIRLFRRTIFINDNADDDSLKAIELQGTNEQHFTYCLIQLYMNGVYKHVNNYRNLTDYNNSTYVLMVFVEIFFDKNGSVSGQLSKSTQKKSQESEKKDSTAVSGSSTNIAEITSQSPEVQNQLNNLKSKVENVKTLYQTVMSIPIIGKLIPQETGNKGTQVTGEKKNQGGGINDESPEKIIENILTEEKEKVDELKQSNKSLDDVIKDLEEEKIKIEAAKEKIDTTESSSDKFKQPLTELNNALDTTITELKALQTPQDAQASLIVITEKPPEDAPVTNILEYLKSTREFTQDTDASTNDIKTNFEMLLNYVDLFKEYYIILYHRKELPEFRKLFFDTLENKNYYKAVKNMFGQNSKLNTSGYLHDSWNTQLLKTVKNKDFDEFDNIIKNSNVKRVFGITSGGGLTITDQDELNKIFNGLFDIIYLEYYGNTNGVLYNQNYEDKKVDKNDKNDTIKGFKSEFSDLITNNGIINGKPDNISNSKTKTQAIIKYYDEQIRFIRSDNTTNGEIKKKRIFIASQFNFLRIQQLIKSNIFSSLWSGSKGLYSYVKNFFVRPPTYSTEDEQNKNIHEMLDELKNRNLLLSTIFKDVRAFGFQKITEKDKDTDKVIIENDDYSSTTTFKNIEWSYLSNYTIEAERGVKKLTKNILSVNPDSVNLMISYVAGLLNPFSIYKWIAGLLLNSLSKYPFDLSSMVWFLSPIYTILASAGAFYGYNVAVAAVKTGLFGFASGASGTGVAVAGIAGLLGDLFTPSISSFFDRVVNSENIGAGATGLLGSTNITSILSNVFSKLKNLLIMFQPEWITSNVGFVSNKIADIIQPLFTIMNIPGIDITSLTGTISGYISTTINYLTGDSMPLSMKIAAILTIGQIYSFTTRKLDNEKMINNNFLYQMFNIITLSDKIKVDSFDKSPNDAILSYIEDEMKRAGALGILSQAYNNDYHNLLMAKSKTKKTYTLTLFDKKMRGNVSPDSLVNLNIPISSFIYAFNEVKATSDTDLAKQLDEYYENKDLFMERRKKKLEGKK